MSDTTLRNGPVISHKWEQIEDLPANRPDLAALISTLSMDRRLWLFTVSSGASNPIQRFHPPPLHPLPPRVRRSLSMGASPVAIEADEAAVDVGDTLERLLGVRVSLWNAVAVGTGQLT